MGIIQFFKDIGAAIEANNVGEWLTVPEMAELEGITCEQVMINYANNRYAGDLEEDELIALPKKEEVRIKSLAT